MSLVWLLLVGTTALAAAEGENSVVIRPEVETALGNARAQLDNLDEKKAVDSLDALLARPDLTPPEVAQAQLWRGVALMGLNRSDDAAGAFKVSRGCQPAMELPSGVSPKIRQLYKNAAPSTCTAAIPTPVPGDFLLWDPSQAAPRAAGRRLASGEGPSTRLIAGSAVAAVGAGVLVVALLGAVGAVSSLVASFPVLDSARAERKAADARRGGGIALGMRIGGGALLAVTTLAGVAAVGALIGGAVVAVLGAMKG